MLVTGFMGSPRKHGNTAYLLDRFLEEAARLGAETRKIHVPDLKVTPCTGCSVCEKKGRCVFKDDMQTTVFPLLRNSGLVVMASPIYFYTVPAEFKAMIDRTQTLWSRKFKLGLKDPEEGRRKGFLLSVGATRGKDLFDSINLTMKYFFRGISTDFKGGLTYARIEDPGDMKKHPDVDEHIRLAAQKLLSGMDDKRSCLFLCRDNSYASLMASAFARIHAGDNGAFYSAGFVPSETANPFLVPVMEEKSLDLAYVKPAGVQSLIPFIRPDHVVIMGPTDYPVPDLANVDVTFWDMDLPESPTMDDMRRIRDDIEERVLILMKTIVTFESIS